MASLAGGVIFCSLGPAFAAEPIADIQAIVQKMKLDGPAVLSGLDRQLAIPQAWVDAAKKNGKLSVYGTFEPDEFDALIAPFKKRYPYVDVKYSNPPRAERVMKPLIGLKANRFLADVSIGLEEGLFHYIREDALENIQDLPGLVDVAPELKDPNGRWVTTKLRYGCAAYNTNKIKEADLPRTWEDMLTSKHLRDGNLALANRPNQWLASLWEVKGEAWATDYVKRMFAELKPQLRKENTTALTNLLAAGEFSMQLPAYELRVFEFKERGAPIEYYCPNPAPAFVQVTGIVRATPNVAAAKIFVNWLLSREGQITHFYINQSVPVDKQLQKMKAFLPRGVDEASEIALLIPTEMDVLPKMYEVWSQLWDNQGGGRSRR
jgi:iron(III) transport system substrate-binding protein